MDQDLAYMQETVVRVALDFVALNIARLQKDYCAPDASPAAMLRLIMDTAKKNNDVADPERGRVLWAIAHNAVLVKHPDTLDDLDERVYRQLVNDHHEALLGVFGVEYDKEALYNEPVKKRRRVMRRRYVRH